MLISSTIFLNMNMILFFFSAPFFPSHIRYIKTIKLYFPNVMFFSRLIYFSTMYMSWNVLSAKHFLCMIWSVACLVLEQLFVQIVIYELRSTDLICNEWVGVTLFIVKRNFTLPEITTQVLTTPYPCIHLSTYSVHTYMVS